MTVSLLPSSSLFYHRNHTPGDLGTIRLVLQVRYFAKPGEFLLVVGDTAGLGEWDVNKALPLELSDSQQDLWRYTFFRVSFNGY